MDVIIVCHTEFGFVHNRHVIADKNATEGVEKGVQNLIQVADKYGAKVTFAVMPEVVKYFPNNINHEIGLHIHAGWKEFHLYNKKFYVGDRYLREHCEHSLNSTVLKDYSYKEQYDMIKIGNEYLSEFLSVKPKVFVAGRWSINNDTVKALINTGITHDCSAPANSKACHHDWSKLPRICMPYHPKENDYQEKGDLSLLIVPISQMFIARNSVTIENVPLYGLPWLKACFIEYNTQNMPLFHICLHSPIMIDPFFISAMDTLLEFISKHGNVNFKFASEINEYNNVNPKTSILPYIYNINIPIIKTGINAIKSRIFKDIVNC